MARTKANQLESNKYGGIRSSKRIKSTNPSLNQTLVNDCQQLLDGESRSGMSNQEGDEEFEEGEGVDLQELSTLWKRSQDEQVPGIEEGEENGWNINQTGGERSIPELTTRIELVDKLVRLPGDENREQSDGFHRSLNQPSTLSQVKDGVSISSSTQTEVPKEKKEGVKLDWKLSLDRLRESVEPAMNCQDGEMKLDSDSSFSRELKSISESHKEILANNEREKFKRMEQGIEGSDASSNLLIRASSSNSISNHMAQNLQSFSFKSDSATRQASTSTQSALATRLLTGRRDGILEQSSQQPTSLSPPPLSPIVPEKISAFQAMKTAVQAAKNFDASISLNSNFNPSSKSSNEKQTLPQKAAGMKTPRDKAGGRTGVRRSPRSSIQQAGEDQEVASSGDPPTCVLVKADSSEKEKVEPTEGSQDGKQPFDFEIQPRSSQEVRKSLPPAGSAKVLERAGKKGRGTNDGIPEGSFNSQLKYGTPVKEVDLGQPKAVGRRFSLQTQVQL